MANKNEGIKQELALQEPTGLANYIIEMNNALGNIPKRIVKDPVVQGLANAIVNNPVIQSTNNYIRTKTPLEVTNDALSVGAIAAAMSNPVTAPIGLARIVGPRTASGIVQAGKEAFENAISNRIANTAFDIGLGVEDTNNIRRALRR